MQHIIGECRTGFLQERHYPVALRLGRAHHHLGRPPPDVLKLERPELLVAQAGCSKQKQDCAVADARRRSYVDRVDGASDFVPSEPVR